MINKASELLEAFIKTETDKLKDMSMPHMPTLGNAYEEITKQGIDRNFVIPKHLNLQVVSGFISIGGDLQPQQIDCMLVHGKGIKYGLTNQYFYPIEQILCIFEVKKTLKKADFIDAFEHLKSIRKKHCEYIEKKLRHGGYEPNISSASYTFSQITGKSAPEKYSGIHNLSTEDGILFYTLVQESLTPLCIIQGYEGYTTEKGLRKVFIDIIEEKLKAGPSGIGIPSFPNLVTSNQFCLIKNNGLPHIAKQGDSTWVAVSSTRYNPARIILELIWSKISFYFQRTMPWEDGLETENLSPLLVAESVGGENPGWVYRTIEPTEKKLRRDEIIEWEPQKLTKYSVSASHIMAANGGYLALDKGLSSFLKEKFNVTLDQLKSDLVSTGHFMVEDEYIRPISPATFFLNKDENTGFVGNDRAKFDLWCDKSNIQNSYMVIVFIE